MYLGYFCLVAVRLYTTVLYEGNNPPCLSAQPALGFTCDYAFCQLYCTHWDSLSSKGTQCLADYILKAPGDRRDDQHGSSSWLNLEHSRTYLTALCFSGVRKASQSCHWTPRRKRLKLIDIRGRAEGGDEKPKD